MMPGLTSRLNEGLVTTLPSPATLDPKSDILTISAAGTYTNINAHFTTFSGILFIVPIVSGVILGSGGNISVPGGNIPLTSGKLYPAVFSRSQQTWYVCSSGAV